MRADARLDRQAIDDLNDGADFDREAATAARRPERLCVAPGEERPRLGDPGRRSGRWRGSARELYALDQVSAVASDVLMERAPNARKVGVVGWLPAREADEDGRIKASYMVTFFTRDDPPLIAYQVHVNRFWRVDGDKIALDASPKRAWERTALRRL